VTLNGGVGGGATGGEGGGGEPPLERTVIVNSRWAVEGRHQSADGGFWSLRLTQNE
jgi:hypothetical protein